MKTLGSKHTRSSSVSTPRPSAEPLPLPDNALSTDAVPADAEALRLLMPEVRREPMCDSSRVWGMHGRFWRCGSSNTTPYRSGRVTAGMRQPTDLPPAARRRGGGQHVGQYSTWGDTVSKAYLVAVGTEVMARHPQSHLLLSESYDAVRKNLGRGTATDV